MKDGLLFLDTESDPITKKRMTIQMRMNGESVIIDHPAKRHLLKEWMSKAEAVIIFNAPYDMGVLSAMKGNSYKYENDKWSMMIEGYEYDVMAINGPRNHIKSHGDAPPVIDLMKLWTILVDDSNFSLKALIKKELGQKPIPYTPENAKTYAYQAQDVECLEKLWYKFLEKISGITNVAGYTYHEWQKINTPATFPKIAYKAEYPMLAEWMKYNEEQDKMFNLKFALEEAYNGGITCALYRGTVLNTGWFDIHGAYAHVIEYENTDQYKKYHWEEADPTLQLERDRSPVLCKVSTDVVMKKVNNSLKLYRVEKPAVKWMWSYDILAMRELFDDAHIKVIKAYRPVPENHVEVSLPAQWSALKEEEQRLHGKTTLREYYKFMSNTSYGITAQREPNYTIHTNMCIAGIITSRAHLILCEMINEARKAGCDWLYSDTDSICVRLNDVNPKELDVNLNKRIAPYGCECEFIGPTRVLSLKRYIARDGTDLEGNKVKDKVRLHGKGQYNITENDMRNMLAGNPNLNPVFIKQVKANTMRTYNRVLKLDPRITHPHPFMFIKDIPQGKTNEEGCFEPLIKQNWFDKWYTHIDTKLTSPAKARPDDEFERDFIKFKSDFEASIYYGEASNSNCVDCDDISGESYRDWDAEDASLFGED